MNVLSLFDGLSGGNIALERAGIKYDKYYASEINLNSIKVAMKNYPNTIQLGDVTKLTEEFLLSLGKIDMLIAGTPCTNLSRIVINNNEHNQGLEGEESKLFYEYIRILKIVKPKYFFLENVESMTNEDRDIITNLLGVEPIMIDSSLVSAQDRKRYYWTNIEGIEQPADKGFVLQDIIEPEVDEKYYYKQEFTLHDPSKKVRATLHIKTHEMLKRVYNLNNKCGTLTGVTGGYQEKKIYIESENRVRKFTPLEYERMQTVPEGYTEGVANLHRYDMLGNGWTIDIIAHIFKGMKL